MGYAFSGMLEWTEIISDMRLKHLDRDFFRFKTKTWQCGISLSQPTLNRSEQTLQCDEDCSFARSVAFNLLPWETIFNATPLRCIAQCSF